jgi:hypothetical protein
MQNGKNWLPLKKPSTLTLHPEKMELFTELLVRSWDAKCDPPDTTKWRNGHPMDE